jgi:hypothetical protein
MYSDLNIPQSGTKCFKIIHNLFFPEDLAELMVQYFLPFLLLVASPIHFLIELQDSLG